MTPWIVDLIKNLSGITLGWILGFASSLIRDWLKKKRKRADTRRAIATELHELAYRLLGVVYLTESAFGNFDRKLLEWMFPLVQKYEGPSPKENIFVGISDLLKKSDTEVAQFAAILMFSGARVRSMTL